ncbi:MAG: MYG1 family protein [Clostridiaceae bacterium]
MEDVSIPKSGYTHGGIFHADDVFSTALLKHINPDISIVRGFEPPDDTEVIVYDIGLGEFDHHQKDNDERENGVPYAAFGKLWRRYAKLVFDSQELIERFDRDIVQPIDYSDNTGEKNMLSLAIASFNPNWNSDEKADEAFFRAVDFAYEILNNEFQRFRGFEAAKTLATEAFKKSDGLVVELERFVPWQEALVPTTALFVIYPSHRGGYNIQIVPKIERASFPKRWLGAEKEELSSEIPGMTFCHKGNFIASAENIEAARNVARLSLEEYKREKEKERDRAPYILRYIVSGHDRLLNDYISSISEDELIEMRDYIKELKYNDSHWNITEALEALLDSIDRHLDGDEADKQE